MNEPELLTPQELIVVCMKCGKRDDGKSTCGSYPDCDYLMGVADGCVMQLAKCEEHHTQQVQEQLRQMKEIALKYQEYESVIIPARIAEERAKLIEWMEEPCTEHPYTAAYWTYRSPEGIQHYQHRWDCPKCWQSIKEGK